jgi:hypothetical protein
METAARRRNSSAVVVVGKGNGLADVVADGLAGNLPSMGHLRQHRLLFIPSMVSRSSSGVGKSPAVRATPRYRSRTTYDNYDEYRKNSLQRVNEQV